MSNEVCPYDKKDAGTGIVMNAVGRKNGTSDPACGGPRAHATRKSEIRVRPIRARHTAGGSHILSARSDEGIGLCHTAVSRSMSEVLGL